MVVGDIETGTELLIIGGGPGGYSAAIRAAQKGVDVTLVEKDAVGGTCLNRGCIPAKALIHASGLKETVEDWEDKGIGSGEIDVDLESVQDWKDGIVKKLDGGVEAMLKKNGVELVEGEAKFESSNTARIEEEHNAEKIRFENAIVATGSTPVELPGLEFNMEDVISSKDLLNLKKVPEELVIVGGGYIGMEAATEFSKLGSEVKIVEARERVLQNFDKEIVDELKNSECYETFYEGHSADRVKYRNEKAVVVAENEGDEVEIEGDKVLVSVGRTAEDNLEAVKIEETGLEIEEGFLRHGKEMRTDQENIFVVGDAAGPPMLAHKGYREGKVAAEVIAGEPAAFDNRCIPKVVYTDPEVAVAGMNEDKAKERFEKVFTGRFPMSASGRSLTTKSEAGFVKVVASGDGKIQGVQAVSPRASDMIAEAVLALEMQAYLEDVANTIHAHPTFPEAFAEACEDALGECIHK